MGGKEDYEEREHLYSIATEIAVKARAIEECEHHPGTYIDLDDDEAKSRAYAIGTNMIKLGEINIERGKLMDAIKSAIDDAGFECYSCKKWEQE